MQLERKQPILKQYGKMTVFGLEKDHILIRIDSNLVIMSSLGKLV